MNGQGDSFLAAWTSLWLRLSTVSIIGLLVSLTMQLHGRVVGWTFHMNTGEVVFEVAAYAIFVALASVALGAVCAAAVAPFLFYRKQSRRHIVEIVTQAAVAIAAFLDFGMGLDHVLGWVRLEDNVKVKAVVFAGYFIAFVAALCIPRRRKQVVSSLDYYLGERATRRAVIGTGIAAAALVVTEAAMGKTATAAAAPKRPSRPTGPNILLVTCDALSADDMSLYGYRLPTTPHIDEFARKSSVFTNYYAGSTFTTPCIATMLTGLSPSEHHVYQLTGRFRGDTAAKTLPRAMRAAGYSTGASISNPIAYFLAEGIEEDYDYFPTPAYRTADFMRLWKATQILHQPQPFGTRSGEFEDLEEAWDLANGEVEKCSPRLFSHTRSGFPPAGSFEQGRQILERMPDGFFLWVHLLAPHAWYLPEANLGRFLPSGELRTSEEQNERFFPQLYGPERQGLIDKARLRYDEFLADTDSAFGAFISTLEGAGRLRNTTVVFSADHGESFAGRSLGPWRRIPDAPRDPHPSHYPYAWPGARFARGRCRGRDRPCAHHPGASGAAPRGLDAQPLPAAMVEPGRRRRRPGAGLHAVSGDQQHF